MGGFGPPSAYQQELDLLGKQMDTLIYPQWFFVENDLHDIATRVREYDDLARLVQDSETGQVGVARWVTDQSIIAGGQWLLAFRMEAAEGVPLTTPDARVLTKMRASDSTRKDLPKWYREQYDEEFARLARQAKEDRLHAREAAERMVVDAAYKRGRSDRAVVPRGI